MEMIEEEELRGGMRDYVKSEVEEKKRLGERGTERRKSTSDEENQRANPPLMSAAVWTERCLTAGLKLTFTPQPVLIPPTLSVLWFGQ